MQDPKNLLTTLSAPVGDIIAAMGKGIADAQKALDQQVLENYSQIYKENNDALMSLRGLGYRPTWYHISEAEANLQISLALTGSSGSMAAKKLYAVPVNASYKNTYDFELNASSSLRFKIVPVPEPTAIEDRFVVPSLAGQSLANARLILKQLGIAYAVSPADAAESAVVAEVSPEPGSILPEGAEVLLTMAG